MKFHAFHFNWSWSHGEAVFVVGIAAGRVGYLPKAKHLYSLRLYLGVLKIEVLWRTGIL